MRLPVLDSSIVLKENSVDKGVSVWKILSTRKLGHVFTSKLLGFFVFP
jgi:hypothetical protein